MRSLVEQALAPTLASAAPSGNVQITADDHDSLRTIAVSLELLVTELRRGNVSAAIVTATAASGRLHRLLDRSARSPR